MSNPLDLATILCSDPCMGNGKKLILEKTEEIKKIFQQYLIKFMYVTKMFSIEDIHIYLFKIYIQLDYIDGLKTFDICMETDLIVGCGGLRYIYSTSVNRKIISYDKYNTLYSNKTILNKKQNDGKIKKVLLDIESDYGPHIKCNDCNCFTKIPHYHDECPKCQHYWLIIMAKKLNYHLECVVCLFKDFLYSDPSE